MKSEWQHRERITNAMEEVIRYINHRGAHDEKFLETAEGKRWVAVVRNLEAAQSEVEELKKLETF